MSLYHVQFDRESYYVEAATLAGAVGIWKQHTGQDDEEPESVALVYAGPVIRAKTCA